MIMFQVNFSPALAADCQNDLTVKKTMLNDLMDMLNFSDEDRERGGEESPERQMHKAYSSSYSPKSLSQLGGGRRHSYAPNDRNVRVQMTRGGKYGRGKKCTTMMLANKLPRIPRRTKAGEDIGGYCEYCGEGDDNDDDAEDDSDNVEVIPIVPGCGLPSVQQPPVPLCKSSANVFPCSHGDSRAEDGVLKSCSSGHLPDGKTCGRKTSTEHRGKNSLKSDSGISSHSASSENSDECKCKHASQFSKRKLRSQTTMNASQMRQSVSDVKVDLDGGVMSKMPLSGNRSKVRSSLRELQLSKNRSGSVMNAANKNGLCRQGSHSGTFSAYITPWIDTQMPGGVNRSAPAIDGAASSSSKNCRYFEPRCYGGFVCVFPFNEATKRWTYNNLDMRVMVRECQHLLRRRLKQAKLNKQAKAHAKGGTTSQSVLWGVRTNPETTVQH